MTGKPDRVDTSYAARQVASLHRSVIEETAPYLALAALLITKGLRRYLALVPAAGSLYTAYEHVRVLREMRGALNTVREMSPALAASLSRSYDRAGVMARQHLESIVRRVGGQHVALREPLRLGPVQPAPPPSQGRYAARALKYTHDVEMTMRRELAVGIIRNETNEAMVQRLAAKGSVRVKGVTAKAADGLVKPAEWMLRRLAVTEAAVAYETQAHQAFLEARTKIPGLLRIWDARMDSRICSYCEPLNGKVSGPDGLFDGESPPAHVSCRCVALPWHPSWGGMAAEIREAA